MTLGTGSRGSHEATKFMSCATLQPAAAKRARSNIHGCAIEVLPDAGHVMSVGEPGLVADRIVAFLP
jgi:pimeloyl-ACP methyl ester carboxylesterase